MKILALLTLTVLALVACSNQALYETLQNNERQDCIKEPGALYDECIQRTSTTYEEYQKQRSEPK